jgi:gamma-glutamyltranspeptidase/glutathione hydrolase
MLSRQQDHATRRRQDLASHSNSNIRHWPRQIAMLSACFVFSACGYMGVDEPTVPLGTQGYVSGFLGGIAADEPRAVIVGRDVLSAGGSAADAAVAMYFTLAVTMPATAGLGGGGICMVHDALARHTETLDFLGQPGTPVAGRAPVMVPGNLRGFFTLQAKYGRLDWRQLVRPAEDMARFGVQVTRASAAEMRAGDHVLTTSPKARALFSEGATGVVGEGGLLRQLPLSAILAKIRVKGAGVLYSGKYARDFAAAAAAAGGALSYQDLRRYKPTWRPSLEIPFVQGTNFYFAAPRTQAGTFGAKVLAILAVGQRFKKADEGERAHLFAEAAQRALLDGGRGFGAERSGDDKVEVIRLAEGYAESLLEAYDVKRVVQFEAKGRQRLSPASGPLGTSFSIIDFQGSAVTCTLTMNGLFGSGRVAGGFGIILAQPPKSSDVRDLSAGAMMLIHKFKGQIFLAASTTGGPAAQAALAEVAIRVAADTGDNLEKALARPRIFRDPVDDSTYVEKGLDRARADGLRGRGHHLVTSPSSSKINAIFCATGVPSKNPSCAIHADPRGFGMATSSN